jgi:hypothetical protein
MMKNLGNMMKQAQQMQEKMQEMQERLQEHQVTGTSGGGMVQVTMNGKYEIIATKIDPSLVDPEDVGVLEDLLTAAVNDAKAKATEYMQEQMKEITGGMELPPGFQFPGM